MSKTQIAWFTVIVLLGMAYLYFLLLTPQEERRPLPIGLGPVAHYCECS